MATRQLSTKQVVNLASDPASGTPGEIYYNTVSNAFKYYNGTSWVEFSSGGAGNSFETIDVPNGTDLVADSATDTLTFTESNGIIITGDSSADSIQFSTNATASNTASTIVARDVDQAFDITAIDFDTADTITNAIGRLHWDSAEETLQLGMPNDVVQSVGMHFYMPPTKNDSGVEIAKGSFVMATGAQGDRITIAKAVTNGTVDPIYMIGVAAKTIANGSETGLIVTNGTVRDINTSAWIVGTVLYPDPSVAGGFTSTKPAAPNIRTPIAIVLRQHDNTGRIYVRMTNGSVLGGTDSNVKFTSPSDNHIITYNGTTSLWENQGLAAAIQEVDGASSGIDADLLDGQHGSHYLDWTNTTNKPDPTITLGGDLSGSITLTDLAGGTLTATVADDSHNHIISNVDGLQTALNDKAPLASPALSGTPTAPTATAGTNSTQIATTAFVQSATSALVDSAPTTLNTLNELAAALGDDPNFATTVTNSIGLKAPLASPTFTGTVILPTSTTSGSSIRIPHGVAPTAPTNGDIWTTTSGLYARISNTTIGPFGQGNQYYQTSAPSSPAVGDIWVDSDETLSALNTNDFALKAGKLSQFASTTSAELAGVISDETGSGSVVFSNSPTLTTPNIGVATGTSFNSITGLSSTNPLSNGTVAVGTATTVARADHVHPSDTTRAALSGATFTGTVVLSASTTSSTSIRIPHGTAPTAPTNGDIWTTTSGLFGRINGTTEQFATQTYVNNNTGGLDPFLLGGM